MDPERAKDTPDPDTIVAVAVGRLGNPPRTTHAASWPHYTSAGTSYS